MTCPHCGVEVLPGNAFCHRCRKRVGPPPSWTGAKRELPELVVVPPAPPEAVAEDASLSTAPPASDATLPPTALVVPGAPPAAPATASSAVGSEAGDPAVAAPALEDSTTVRLPFMPATPGLASPTAAPSKPAAAPSTAQASLSLELDDRATLPQESRAGTPEPKAASAPLPPVRVTAPATSAPQAPAVRPPAATPGPVLSTTARPVVTHPAAPELAPIRLQPGPVPAASPVAVPPSPGPGAPSLESLLDEVVPRQPVAPGLGAAAFSEPDPAFIESLLKPHPVPPAAVASAPSEPSSAPTAPIDRAVSARPTPTSGPRLAPALIEDLEAVPVPRSVATAVASSPQEGESDLARPLLLTVVAVLDGLAAFCLLGIAGILVLAGAAAGWSVSLALGVLFLVVVAAASSVAVVGVLRLQAWGRSLQIGLSIVGLIAFPVGTALGGLLLYHLCQPGMRILFSGRKREELTVEEAASVVRVSGGQAGLVALVTAAVVLIGTFLIGIIAAIAIPSLLRARVAANEASAIGRAREMVSAQTMYATSNGGFYGPAECLAAPAQCIPGYAGIPFHEAGLEETQHGYHAKLHLGPPPPHDVLERGEGTIASSSVSSFTYVLTPVAPGQTGIRAFCADHQGVICAFPGEMTPPADQEACPESCVVIR